MSPIYGPAGFPAPSARDAVYEYEHHVKDAGGARQTDEKTIDVRYRRSDVEAFLNKKGAEGWGVVSMEPWWEYRVDRAGNAVPVAVRSWLVTLCRQQTDGSAP